MPGEHYVLIECVCGHRHMTWLEDWPEHMRQIGHLKPEVLDRLKCSACGRIGRPRTTICGWAHLGRNPESHLPMEAKE